MSEPKAAGARKTPPAHRFGFCQTEASSNGEPVGAGSEWHARCPSALTTAQGLVLCDCPGHLTDRKCHRCNTEVEAAEGYNPERRQHVNPEACGIAADLKHAARRAEHEAMMAAVRGDIASQRATARAQRTATNGDAPVTETEPKAPRAPKAPKIPQRCHCGCGGMTKGGRFAAGHDAKLKSQLRTTDDTDTTATLDARRAELIARGWLPGSDHPAWVQEGKEAMLPGIKRAETLIERHGGSDAVIARAVAARYGEETTSHQNAG